MEALLKLMAFGIQRFFKDRWEPTASLTKKICPSKILLGQWAKSVFRLFLIDVLRWNQLDIAIVALSIMGITLEELKLSAALPINPTIIRIMRVLRIARGSHAHSYTTQSTCIPPQTTSQSCRVFVELQWIIFTTFYLWLKWGILSFPTKTAALSLHSSEASEDGHRDESPAGHSHAGTAAGMEEKQNKD